MSKVNKDSLWKGVIEDFFPDFFTFFLGKWNSTAVRFT